MVAEVREHDPRLVGKKILMVDDDARNIFAITSALERANIEVVYAENGKVALDRLRQIPEIDLVLMDIMMPEMDGYEAMRAIRNMEAFESLPIIAVTAKAMLGDREKCVRAGASDYIAKPADLDQLFSLLRVWLPDRPATAAAASMD
jgi:CheY-like chemotaxis protein